MGRAALIDTTDEDHLLAGADRLLRATPYVDQLLPKDLQRHAVWNVLLNLYVSSAKGRICYVKQVVIITDESPATAIRTIHRLEEASLIRRERDYADRRRMIVRLTGLGRATVLSLLRFIFTPEGHGSPEAFGNPSEDRADRRAAAHGACASG